MLLNIAYTLKCNSNLILLGQFQESDILYHDHPNSIILKQKRGILEAADKYKNLFIFETDLRKKAILV